MHSGRIKPAGLTSLYFTPICMSGPKEEYHEKLRSTALAVKRWFEEKGVDVTFIDKYQT